MDDELFQISAASVAKLHFVSGCAISTAELAETIVKKYRSYFEDPKVEGHLKEAGDWLIDFVENYKPEPQIEPHLTLEGQMIYPPDAEALKILFEPETFCHCIQYYCGEFDNQTVPQSRKRNFFYKIGLRGFMFQGGTPSDPSTRIDSFTKKCSTYAYGIVWAEYEVFPLPPKGWKLR